MKKRFLTMFALLLLAATGAWAQEETLLTTITPTSKDSYSETTAGVVTVTHDNSDIYGEYGWVWWANPGSITVEAKEGYTITRCVFRQSSKTPVTVSSAPFKVSFIETANPSHPDQKKFMCQGDWKLNMNGVSSIEVYGYANAPAPATYSVTLAEGTEDSDNWTISPAEAAEGAKVTATYSGEKKVKSVKAVKKAAPAPKPDFLAGVFSVSASKKVNFSKGNLRYASSKWSFFDNQYDYYASYSADAWDHFGWSTSATTYGMNTSTDNLDYSGDFVDWGATMGTGWFTLSKDEWTYLFNTRSASTVGNTENGRYAKAKVNDVNGVILFPDTYTHPDGVTVPTNVNTATASLDSNTYTVADWTKMESAGCVFLPAASSRNGSESGLGSGYYWSATPNDAVKAYNMFCGPDYLTPAFKNSRFLGFSVRLVREVTE